MEDKVIFVLHILRGGLFVHTHYIGALITSGIRRSGIRKVRHTKGPVTKVPGYKMPRYKMPGYNTYGIWIQKTSEMLYILNSSHLCSEIN
jgi:hypothetical protein